MLEIFTIVLNGMPFIDKHLPIYSKLRVPWKWHIIEGVAKPENCTKWCSNVRPTDHSHGLSNDGTSEYLDSISCDNIHVYRKPKDEFWTGKLEMCNAPLNRQLGVPMFDIEPSAVLHQIDVDEFWTHLQLETIHDLFKSKNVGRAWYHCNFYMGPDLSIKNRVKPAVSLDCAWIRTHRYVGQPWVKHEPPTIRYVGRDARHAETEKLGLVFNHFAYVLENQLAFKENYYQYTDAVEQWKRMQASPTRPMNPGHFLSWVDPVWNAVLGQAEHYESVINRIHSL